MPGPVLRTGGETRRFFEKHYFMKWYKTYSSIYHIPEIVPVEIERFTDSFVTINGRRNSRISTYECYFESKDLAKQYLLAQCKSDIESLKEKLANQEERMLAICQL